MDSPKSGNFPALPPFPRNFRPRNIQNHPKNPKFGGIFSPLWNSRGDFPAWSLPKKLWEWENLGIWDRIWLLEEPDPDFGGFFRAGSEIWEFLGGKSIKMKGKIPQIPLFPQEIPGKTDTNGSFSFSFPGDPGFPFPGEFPGFWELFLLFFGAFPEDF